MVDTETENMNKISISSILKVCFSLVAAHCGANPEKHQNGVWSSPGAIQQDHSWAAAGPRRREGTGGAAARRQQKPAVCQAEAGEGTRTVPRTSFSLI